MALNKLSKGFTLLEVLIVLGIVALLFLIGSQPFYNANNTEALGKDTLQVLSVLRQARSYTLDSKNADQYGVHFQSSKIFLFEGASYVAGNASNTETDLNSRVTISSINLTGGGSDVIFDQLTGKTSEDGKITLSLVSTPTSSSTITIYKTGLAQSNSL